MHELKYGQQQIMMSGIIVEVSDGAVSIDLKGRLGFFKVPMRMIISDEALEIGQEVGFIMSYPEVTVATPNQDYISNIQKRNDLKK